MPQKIPLCCWCWVLIFFIASPLKSQILETAIQYADLEFNASGNKIDVVNSELIYGGFDHDQIVFIDKGNQGMAAVLKIGEEFSTSADLKLRWVSSSGTFSMHINGSLLFDGSGVQLSETPVNAGDELILAIDGEYVQYRLNNEILETRNVPEVSGEIEAQFSGNTFPNGKIQVGIAPYTITPIPEVSFITPFQSIYAGQEIEVCATLNFPNEFSTPLVAEVSLVNSGSNLLPGFSTQQISFLPGENQLCFNLPTNSELSDPQASIQLALSVVDSLQLMLGEPDTMVITLRPEISPPVSLVFTAFDNQIGGVSNAETDQITMTTLQELLPGSVFYFVKGTSVEGGVWEQQQVAIQKVTYEGSTIIPPGSIICFSIPATCDGDAFLANGFTVNGQNADFLVSSFGSQVAPDINFLAGESSSLSIVQGSWAFEEGRAILNGQTVTTLSLGTSVSEQGTTNALPGIESNTSQYGFFTCDQTTTISTEQLRNNIALGENWTILSGTADNDLPSEVCTASCPVLDSFPPPVWVSLPDTLFINCQVLDLPISIDQWLQSNGGGSVISEFCGSEIEVFNTYNEELAYACSDEGMVVTFIARDTCGGLAMANAPIVLLNNQPPEFQVLPQDTTVACMPDTLLAVTFQDWLNRQGGATVTANCGVDWTYTYQWLQDCPEENTQAIVTFFATDYCGQSISHTVNFLIDPTKSWTFSKVPVSLSLNLGEPNFNTKLNQWLDNQAYIGLDYYCSTISWSHSYTGALDSICGTADIVFSALSACGDTYQFSSRLTVADTIAPELVTPPQDLKIACGDDSGALIGWLQQFAGATVKDNLGRDNLEWRILTDTDTLLSGTCSEKTIWFEVRDFCGNALSYSAQLIRSDIISPTIRTAGGEQVSDVTILYSNSSTSKEALLNNWLRANAGLVVFDNCTPATEIEVSYVLLNSSPDDHYVYELVFTDECGNSSMVSRAVQLIDNTPPLLSGGVDLYLVCDTEQQMASQIDNWLSQNAFINYTDQSAVSVTHNFSVTESCFNQEVVFTFTDQAGNRSYQKQQIIQDIRAPKLRLPDALDTMSLMTLSCNQALVSLTFRVEDACVQDWNWVDHTFVQAITSNGEYIVPDWEEATQVNSDSVELSFFLPSGDYSLEIKVTDKCGNTGMVSQNISISPLPDDCLPSFELAAPLIVRQSAVDYWQRLAFLQDSLKSITHQVSFACSADTNLELTFDSIAIRGLNQKPIPLSLFSPANFCANYTEVVEVYAWTNCGGEYRTPVNLQLINDQPLELISGPQDSTLVPTDYEILASWIGFTAAGDLTAKPYEDWLKNYGGAQVSATCDLSVTFELLSDESCFSDQVAYLDRLVAFTFTNANGETLVDTARFVLDHDFTKMMQYPVDTIVTSANFELGLFDRVNWLDHGMVQDSCNYIVVDSLWADSTTCTDNSDIRIWKYYRTIEDQGGRIVWDTMQLTVLNGSMRLVSPAADTLVSPEEDWIALANAWMYDQQAGFRVDDQCRAVEYSVDTIAYIDCPNRTLSVQFTATDLTTGEVVSDTADFIVDGFGSKDSLLIIPPKDTLVAGPIQDNFNWSESGVFEWRNNNAGAQVITPCNDELPLSKNLIPIQCNAYLHLFVGEFFSPVLEDTLVAFYYTHDTVPEHFPKGVDNLEIPFNNQSEHELDAITSTWLSGFCASEYGKVETLSIDCPEPGIYKKVIATFSLEYKGRVLLRSTRELSFIQDQISRTQPATDQWSASGIDYQHWKDNYGGLRATTPCEEPNYSIASELEYEDAACGFTNYELVFKAENHNGDFVLDTATFVLYGKVPAPELSDSTYYVTDSLSYVLAPKPETWAAQLSPLKGCADLYTTTSQVIDSTTCAEDEKFGTWTYQLKTENNQTAAWRLDTIYISIKDARPAFAGGILFDRYMVHDGTNATEISAAIEEWKNTFPNIALERVGCKEVEVIEYSPEEFVAACAVIIDTSRHYDQYGNSFTLNKGELHTVHLLKLRIENELGQIVTVYSKFYEIYPAQSWLSEARDSTYAYQGGGATEIQSALQNWITEHGGANTISPCPNDHPVVWSHDTISIDTDEAGFGTYTIQFTATVQGTNRQLTTQATFRVEIPCSTLELATEHTDVLCNGTNDGSASASALGGTPGYSYRWDTGSTSSTISGLSGGIYRVTVTDSNGCTVSRSVTISEPSALNISASKTTVSCNGGNDGSASVSVSGGTPGYNYRWSTGSNSSTISGLSKGIYWVTVTDGNGCKATRTVTISEPTALSVSISKTNVSCNGSRNGSASVSVSGGSSGYSYHWNTGSTSSTISGLSGGNYSVTVTDASGCTTSRSVTISEPTALSVSISKTNVSCNGSRNGSASVSVSGGSPGYSYRWNTGSTSSTISGLSGGNYSVTVTDASGCTATRSVLISESSSLGMNAFITETCNGGDNGQITVAAFGGVPGYSYVWNTGRTGATISNLRAGVYSVTMTDASGCTLTRSYSLGELPALNINYSKANVDCFGGNSGSISLNVSGGDSPYYYQWNTGATSSSLNSLRIGTYTVTVSDSKGCTATQQITITQPSPLGINSQTKIPACYQDGTGEISVSGTGGTPGYSYTWSTGDSSPKITNLSSGTYTVTLTDANGCTTVRNLSFSEPPPLSIAYNKTDVECAGESTGTINLDVSGGTGSYSYQWNTGASSSSLNNLGKGTYSVTVTDANGCTANQSISIRSNLSMTLTSVVKAETCTGQSDGSIEVAVQGGKTPYRYLWSTGSQNPIILNLSARRYTVTVTDANDCQLIKSFLVSSLGDNCTFLRVPNKAGSTAQIQNQLRLFPNPTSNDVFLEYQNESQAQNMEVEFFDKAGRLLKQVKQEIYQGHNRFSVPTWDLPPGLYIVRTKAGQDIQMKKLIVVKN